MGRTRGPLIDVEYEAWLANKDELPTTKSRQQRMLTDILVDKILDRKEAEFTDPTNQAPKEDYEAILPEVGQLAISAGFSVDEFMYDSLGVAERQFITTRTRH